jgi:hypothetical protein
VFSGAFDPQVLENLLNSYAANGWRLAEGFMAASLWKSLKAEIVLILERERPDGDQPARSGA